ncbi:hypothetical protein FQR65_LT15092 [Abscondita terminalis]|nr:hypothetical protein FQR65_LT15092 [Abscondita terminalis]
MPHYAAEYYKTLQKTVMITGTKRIDRFVIKKEKHKVSVLQYRHNTDEIWIYGLDDDDIFDVSGSERTGIKIRLIGGLNHDVYNIKDGRNVKLYDFKSQKNTYNITGYVAKQIKDDYDINTYNFEKPQYNFWAGYPSIGYNPDEGVKVGAVVNYTHNGFDRDPYTSRHTFKTNYSFATSGIEFIYNGVFPNAIGKWTLHLDGRFTTPDFAQNYFGFGNNTANYDDELGRNYKQGKYTAAADSTFHIKKKSFMGFVQTFQLAGYDYGRVWMDGEYSRKWHQSVGGGIWVSILEAFSARATYFTGSDGGRFSAGIGMRF